MKTVTLKIDWNYFMKSHEQAFLRITSPSGHSIDLYKKHSNLHTEEEKLVWDKLVNKQEIVFTHNEMILMKVMSKIPYFATKRS